MISENEKLKAGLEEQLLNWQIVTGLTKKRIERASQRNPSIEDWEAENRQV